MVSSISAPTRAYIVGHCTSFGVVVVVGVVAAADAVAVADADVAAGAGAAAACARAPTHPHARPPGRLGERQRRPAWMRHERAVWGSGRVYGGRRRPMGGQASKRIQTGYSSLSSVFVSDGYHIAHVYSKLFKARRHDTPRHATDGISPASDGLSVARGCPCTPFPCFRPCASVHLPSDRSVLAAGPASDVHRPPPPPRRTRLHRRPPPTRPGVAASDALPRHPSAPPPRWWRAGARLGSRKGT